MGISIGELAQSAGVKASAIRYYEKAGLIAEPGRRSGRRVYDADDVRTLGFITRARSAGFRISEIEQLVSLMHSSTTPEDYCAEAKDLARAKAEALEQQIAEATQLREQLLAALDTDCSGLDECAVMSGV